MSEIRTIDEHAHLKVWIVLTDDRMTGTAVLSGSANLTGKGLGLGGDTHGDGEAMAEVFDHDLEEIVGKVRRLWAKASPHDLVLRQALQSPASTRHAAQVRPVAQQPATGNNGRRGEPRSVPWRKLTVVGAALAALYVVGAVNDNQPQQQSFNPEPATVVEPARREPVTNNRAGTRPHPA